MAGITYPYGSNTVTMDAFLSATLQRYYEGGKFQNAAHNSSPLFAWLKSKGRMETMDGGHQITVNVRYGGNETVGPVNEAEELDLSLQDGMTRAIYDWSEYAGAVSITNKEKAENSGKGQLVNLAKEKVTQTLETYAEQKEKHLFDTTGMTASTGSAGTSATGASQILPLPLLVHYTPTAASNIVGTIDANTHNFWANQSVDYGATNTFAAFRRKFGEIYQKCTVYGPGGSPDFGVVDLDTWLNYVVVLESNMQYQTGDQDLASLGFENVKYLGATLVPSLYACDPEADLNYDASPTAGVLYLLNSKYLKYCVMKGRDFKPGEFRHAPKQLMSTAIFESQEQLIVTNRKKHGVLYGITKTAPTLTAS